MRSGRDRDDHENNDENERDSGIVHYNNLPKRNGRERYDHDREMNTRYNRRQNRRGRNCYQDDLDSDYPLWNRHISNFDYGY